MEKDMNGELEVVNSWNRETDKWVKRNSEVLHLWSTMKKKHFEKRDRFGEVEETGNDERCFIV